MIDLVSHRCHKNTRRASAAIKHVLDVVVVVVSEAVYAGDTRAIVGLSPVERNP